MTADDGDAGRPREGNVSANQMFVAGDDLLEFFVLGRIGAEVTDANETIGGFDRPLIFLVVFLVDLGFGVFLGFAYFRRPRIAFALQFPLPDWPELIIGL